VPPVTAVRGSLLVIDWRWLRENGHFEAYTRRSAATASCST
jgi:hypothetical protein